MKAFLPLLILLSSAGLRAETTGQLIASYSAQASAAQPGFAVDAARGRDFARRDWGLSGTLKSCAACHTGNPRGPGRHVATGKTIRPLSPVVNPDRFSDAAKVEKWFRRNCNEVVGRPCTAAEKADYIAFANDGVK